MPSIVRSSTAIERYTGVLYDALDHRSLPARSAQRLADQVLVASGVFNPSFATYRMEATEDGYMARVFTSWSITSRCVQPLFMALGGVLAALIGIRGAMYVAGGCCLVSAAVLPWQSAKPVPLPEPV